MVKNLDEINQNIENKVFSLVDARSKDSLKVRQRSQEKELGVVLLKIQFAYI